MKHLDTETIGGIDISGRVRDDDELALRILDEVQQIAVRLAVLEAKLDTLTRRLIGAPRHE